MMYLRLGEDGFDRDCPKLVLFPPGGDPERIATITAKRPANDRDQRNWAVGNGASEKGDLQWGWEDNDRFFKYLKHARDAELKGEIAQRRFTIKEGARSGWWKQHKHTGNNCANTIIPTHLRFRLPDADQGCVESGISGSIREYQESRSGMGGGDQGSLISGSQAPLGTQGTSGISGISGIRIRDGGIRFSP